MNISDKTHGPYDGERYICDPCWSNNALFFPDKKFYTGSYRFKTVSNSIQETFISSKVQSSITEKVNKLSKSEPSKYTLNVTPDKRIEAELVDIPLDNLKLDPQNVRFRHKGRELSNAEIIDFIWNDVASKNLYQQIKFSQGLSEEPLVDSNYIVKEGNMRIVCLLKLKEAILKGDESIPLEKIDPVRVILLPKDISEIDIAILLTRLHVTGKTEWEALNKAAHIYDLSNKFGYSYDKITETCGMSKSTVINSIEAFTLNLRYHEKYPEDSFWVNRFSYFIEFFKKKKALKEWFNENNMELFMQWVSTGQTTKGADVRLLPQIVENPKALEAMLKGSTVQDALKILGTEDPSMTSKSFKTLKTAINELQKFPRNELIDTIKNPAKMRMLQTLYDELGNLINDIKTVSER